MADIARVISGVEHHMGAGFCSDCPYFKECDDEEPGQVLLDDLMEILKSREPRLLTLEEIGKLPGGVEDNMPVCVEQRYPVGKWDGGSHVKWAGASFCQEEYLHDNVYYNPETYNATWRCWTGWPTMARREATAWTSARGE